MVIYVTVAAAVVLVSAILLILANRRIAPVFRELASRTGGRATTYFLLPSVIMTRSGSPARIVFIPPSKSSPSRVDVLLRKKLPFTLYLCPERLVPPFFKSTGLLREIVINVPDFDRKYLIRTSNPNLCSVYLADSRNRAVIEELAASGWHVGFQWVGIRACKQVDRDFLSGTGQVAGFPGVGIGVAVPTAAGEVTADELIHVLDQLVRLGSFWM